MAFIPSCGGSNEPACPWEAVEQMRASRSLAELSRRVDAVTRHGERALPHLIHALRLHLDSYDKFDGSQWPDDGGPDFRGLVRALVAIGGPHARQTLIDAHYDSGFGARIGVFADELRNWQGEKREFCALLGHHLSETELLGSEACVRTIGVFQCSDTITLQELVRWYWRVRHDTHLVSVWSQTLRAIGEPALDVLPGSIYWAKRHGLRSEPEVDSLVAAIRQDAASR